MRYQGRLTSWNDDRGFGFITPGRGGNRIFVHISGFGRDQRRPTGNELVTYELFVDKRKGPRAEAVRYVGGGSSSARPPPSRYPRGRPRRAVPTRSAFFLILLLSTAWLGWYWYDQAGGREATFLKSRPATASFECRGKTRCSQMRSCDEALFYLDHCPDVKIDGDRDGVPCESQWCDERLLSVTRFGY